MKVILFSDGNKLEKQSLTILRSLNIDVVDIVSEKNPDANYLPDADVLVSMCYHYKVRSDVLNKYDKCINFHPAPLPEYKGFAVYNFGLYNEETTWGVSAHYMIDEFDEGDIIDVIRFDIGEESVASLRSESHKKQLELFIKLMKDISNGKEILPVPNKGGTNYTKKMFEDLRKLDHSMSQDEVERRTRACYFPPYEGVYYRDASNI